MLIVSVQQLGGGVLGGKQACKEVEQQVAPEDDAADDIHQHSALASLEQAVHDGYHPTVKKCSEQMGGLRNSQKLRPKMVVVVANNDLSEVPAAPNNQRYVAQQPYHACRLAPTMNEPSLSSDTAAAAAEA